MLYSVVPIKRTYLINRTVGTFFEMRSVKERKSRRIFFLGEKKGFGGKIKAVTPKRQGLIIGTTECVFCQLVLLQIIQLQCILVQQFAKIAVQNCYFQT